MSESPLPIDPSQTQPAEKLREVSFRFSPNFPDLLHQLRASLLVSTYQAGKLVVLNAQEGKLNLAFHNFDRPMGLAIAPDQIAVGARTQIWFLNSAPEIVRQLQSPPLHRGEGRGEGVSDLQYQDSFPPDACLLTRRSHVTGEIQCHEMAFASPSSLQDSPELWIVNTLFSCLCTLDPKFNFVPRWQPPFITALAAEDRCHLNGLAMQQGKPKYVTAMAETDTPAGWRTNKVQTGCLIDITTNQIIARGFAMPHSPRMAAGQLWLLDSGRGQLVRVDPSTGSSTSIAAVPGYARGLAIHNNIAFIGLSKIRETSTFGGVPIAEKRDELRCGIGAVDLATGRTIATFEFTAGVDEIFDVSLLPGITTPLLRGPHPTEDGHPTLWLVPQPKISPSPLGRGPG